MMKKPEKTPVRRPIESEYARALNAAVPIATWRRICERAVKDAVGGDSKSREWLAKYLMQTETRTLTVLAAEDSLSDSKTAAEQEIADQRERIDLDRLKVAADRQLTEIMGSVCG